MTSTEVCPHSEKLKFEPSLQEQLLLPQIQNNNVLVVYSTEGASIRIHALLILFYLNQVSNDRNPRILILAKRNNQLKFQSSLKTHLSQRTTILNGSILPNARRHDYNSYSVIFSTPKIIKNDLIDNFFPPNHFSLIIVHQAELGSSSSLLRYIVNKLTKCRIIGLTQMTDSGRLKQVCINLKLNKVIPLEESFNKHEKSNIQHYSLPLPQEYFFMLEILDQIKMHELEEINKQGYDISSKSKYNEINAIHESLKKENNPKMLIRISNLLRIMNLQKIVVSQGFPAVYTYFNNLESRLEDENNFQGKLAIVEFLADVKIRKIRDFISIQKSLQHPKIQMVLKLISQYNSRISIVSHNYHNARFLKEYLKLHNHSVIQLNDPLSSFTEIGLERVLLPFTENKVRICITNTVNEIIARKAAIIVAYDVNADIVDTLNNLNVDIPKVFLVAKQTNEEARFFYLKRLGSQPQVRNSNFHALNQSLVEIKESESEIGLETGTNDTNESGTLKNILTFNSSLFELGFPYLFSKKEYSIHVTDDYNFPGFILDQKICFLILVPETIAYYFSEKPHQLINSLFKEFSQVHLIIFPQSLATLSFDFRCDILHHPDIWIFFLTEEQDIPKLVKRVIDKPLYNFNLSDSH